MVKNHLQNGLTYYTCSVDELRLIGGLGICDDCGDCPPLGGYLVPVLNHYQCVECFESWSARAKHYPEDDWFEQINMRYWESRIPLEDLDDDMMMDDYPMPSNASLVFDLNDID